MNTFLAHRKLVQWEIWVKIAVGTYPRQDVRGQERLSINGNV